jgi:RHS repeat-associated protein
LLTSATVGGATATFGYDPLTRLYSSTSAARLQYDGDSVIAEYVGSSMSPRHRYVHGPGIDEPLVWYDIGSSTTTRRYMHADERGSVVAVSQADGTLWNGRTYDEYGRPGSANFGRFQYTGQSWLAEAGLYYYRARWYNPRLGRFMQADPIGYGDGMNMYAYVGGDPVNSTDSTGLGTMAECLAEQAAAAEETTIVCGGGLDPWINGYNNPLTGWGLGNDGVGGPFEGDGGDTVPVTCQGQSSGGSKQFRVKETQNGNRRARAWRVSGQTGSVVQRVTITSTSLDGRRRSPVVYWEGWERIGGQWPMGNIDTLFSPPIPASEASVTIEA